MHIVVIYVFSIIQLGITSKCTLCSECKFSCKSFIAKCTGISDLQLPILGTIQIWKYVHHSNCIVFACIKIALAGNSYAIWNVGLGGIYHLHKIFNHWVVDDKTNLHSLIFSCDVSLQLMWQLVWTLSF